MPDITNEKSSIKKSFNPTESGKTWFLIPILSIPVLNFLIFWVGVNFQSILNAFRIEEFGEIKFSLINWKYLWDDLFGANPYSDLKLLLRNTFVYFGVGFCIVLPLSLILAYFLYKKIRFYKYYRIIFFLPNIISAAVLATLYKFMFNPSVGGIIPQIYQALTGKEAINFLMSPDHALTAVVIYSIWTGFSVNLIIFNGAMARVPISVVEAAKLDGVSMTQEFFQILLPLMWPTLSTIIITNFAGIFTSSGAVLLLTGGDYDTASISFWIYIQTKNQLSIYYPSTVGLACSIVAFPLVLGVKKLTELIYPDVAY